MTTTEIIENFMKGNSKATITEKQKYWLLAQAKREGVPTYCDGYSNQVYFDDCFYKIKQCKTLASGGSFVGTQMIQGKYNIEKMFTIRFTENEKHTAVYAITDLEHFKRENIGFEIIKPHINTATR